jgi:hypothetical protein
MKRRRKRIKRKSARKTTHQHQQGAGTHQLIDDALLRDQERMQAMRVITSG